MDIHEKTSSATDRDRPGQAEPTDKVRGAVNREVDAARERAAAGAEALRSAAGDMGGMTTLVTEQAERRKEEAAEGLRGFADAVRRASDELGAQDNSMAARLVQEAAQGVERLAGGLQSRSVADMGRDASAFGRAHPATFIAGCLIAGVAIGRLLGATGDHGADEDPRGGDSYGATSRPYGGAGYGGGATAAGGYGDTSMGRSPYGGELSTGATGAGMADRPDAARQAGVFGGAVAPASGMGAPGEGRDPLATRMDDGDDAGASDSVLGEPPVGAVPFTSDERRDGGNNG